MHGWKAANLAVNTADLVLALGMRFDDRVTGKPDKFAVGDLRKIAGTALRHLKSRGVKKFVFLAREGERGTAAIQAVVEGLTVADFESNKYHTEKKKDEEIQTVLLA